LRYFSFQVIDSDPMVRPWKLLVKATMVGFLVIFLAIFMATSTASVPVFCRKTVPNLAGRRRENSSTNRSRAGVEKLRGTAHTSSICRLTASTILGLAWPRKTTPWLVLQSTYRLPWSSQTYCMKPRTILTPYSR
jgi:hypothetical protein